MFGILNGFEFLWNVLKQGRYDKVHVKRQDSENIRLGQNVECRRLRKEKELDSEEVYPEAMRSVGGTAGTGRERRIGKMRIRSSLESLPHAWAKSTCMHIDGSFLTYVIEFICDVYNSGDVRLLKSFFGSYIVKW